jgi:DNA polymerase III subunit delta'
MSSSSTASRLDQLIGLDGAKKAVRSLIRSNFDTHALLLYGVEGCGKNELAQILSGLWLCNEPDHEQGADGECRACGAFARDTNPDVLVVAPRGAGNLIGIGQVEFRKDADEPFLSIQEFLRTGPLLSRHKVVIMTSADRMNGSASNSLLKTLEEPPAYAKFVLTTSYTSGVRSTILSRVLAVACSLPTDDEVRRMFPTATEDDLLIAEKAPGRIAKILKNPDPYRDLAAFAKSLPQRRKYEALAVSERFRTVAEKLDAKIHCGARSANAEVTRLLCILCSRDASAPVQWGHSFIEAHERIMMNGNSGLIFDALFAKILQ